MTNHTRTIETITREATSETAMAFWRYLQSKESMLRNVKARGRTTTGGTIVVALSAENGAGERNRIATLNENGHDAWTVQTRPMLWRQFEMEQERKSWEQEDN